jgi:hypothetical protein
MLPAGTDHRHGFVNCGSGAAKAAPLSFCVGGVLQTGAADLKFLHWSPQIGIGNLKSKNGTRLCNCQCPVSEVRVSVFRNESRTSEAGRGVV